MLKDIFQIVTKIKEMKGLESDEDVSAALGMTRTALSNHKTRRTIPWKQLLAFCDKEGISPDTLLSEPTAIDNQGFPSELFYLENAVLTVMRSDNATLRDTLEKNIVAFYDLLMKNDRVLTEEETNILGLYRKLKALDPDAARQAEDFMEFHIRKRETSKKR